MHIMTIKRFNDLVETRSNVAIKDEASIEELTSIRKISIIALAFFLSMFVFSSLYYIVNGASQTIFWRILDINAWVISARYIRSSFNLLVKSSGLISEYEIEGTRPF